MKTTHRFVLHADSGHGWLAVKRTLLNDLEVVPSALSFQRGGTVYLEEDCDAGLFLRALKQRGDTYTVRTSYTDGHSRVRSYAGYRA
jgi:hypothetical protein